jgi:hypothetical protein
MRILALLGLFPALALQIPSAVYAGPTVHYLKATPTTVHRGFVEASLPPVMTIETGDIER